MDIVSTGVMVDRPTHPWLIRARLAFVPGPTTPMLDEVTAGLLGHIAGRGHELQPGPTNETDIVLTTARFGEPIDWRRAPLFAGRRRFGLDHVPTTYTLLDCTPARMEATLVRLERLLAKDDPTPEDLDFPGVAPRAYRVLYEQGRRGGPMLALLRLLQAQSKCVRILLFVGEGRPEAAYTFDLVGAFPRTPLSDLPSFYDDLLLRMLTAVSTREVNQHVVLDGLVSADVWRRLSTPAAMVRAGQELGRRGFFTEMLRVMDLVQIPSLNEAVASQYSEGCFSTWEPAIDALIVTATGSARPVDKGNLTDADLAVVAGVRPDGSGALVRHVEGKANSAPSTEAVEMRGMDAVLPSLSLGPEWGLDKPVPVVRSKVHGHRGVGSYDATLVEFAPLDPAYYHYPVSCATEAQAAGIKAAFSRSVALNHPDDRRRLVFTVLPGHGVVIAEKWVAGTAPLQTVWEYMDRGVLRLVSQIPQGPMHFAAASGGHMRLVE